MKMVLKLAAGFAVAVALTVTPTTSYAATLFSSDMSTSTGWTVGAISADDLATFGFDYSVYGIPAAPGAADTVGLKLESNTADSTGSEGVTVWSNSTFSGKYIVEFDVWGNYGLDGGTTEYFGGGIGHDQASMMSGVGSSSTAGGSGGTLMMVTDASSSRDYRLYKDSGEQFTASGQYAVTSNNQTDGDFDSIGPVVDLSLPPLDVQGQTGSSPLGGPAFNWHHITISVDEPAGTAKFEIDTLELGTLDANVGSSFALSGAMSLIQMDTFSSTASPAGLAFSIYDNVTVTAIPEPSSLVLFSLSGLAMVSRRRR